MKKLLSIVALLLLLVPLTGRAQTTAENEFTFITDHKTGTKVNLIIVANDPIIMEGLQEKTPASWWYEYTVTNQKIKIKGNVKQFSGAWADLTYFSIRDHKTLEQLTLSYNKNITGFTVYGCTALKKIEASHTIMLKDAMDKLIASLPDCSKSQEKHILAVFDFQSLESQINWDIESIRAANARGWSLYADYSLDRRGIELYPDQVKITRDASAGAEVQLGFWAPGNCVPLFTNIPSKPVLHREENGMKTYQVGSEIVISGNTEELHCPQINATKLELGRQHCLKRLEVHSNKQLSELDLSGCSKLEYLSCFGANIKGEAASRLFASLPDRSTNTEKGEVLYIDPNNSDKNEYTDTDILLANKRGWKVMKLNSENKTEEIVVTEHPNVITFKTSRAVGETIAFDFIVKDGSSVTATGLTDATLKNEQNEYTLTDQTVTLTGDLTGLFLHKNDITSFSVRNHTTIDELDIYDNPISTLEIENCPLLREIDCGNIGLSAEAMSALIAALPDRNDLKHTETSAAVLTVNGLYSSHPANVYNDTNIEAAEAKNWKMRYFLNENDAEACLKSSVPVLRLLTEAKPNTEIPALLLSYEGTLLAHEGLKAVDGSEIISSEQPQKIKLTRQNIRLGGNVLSLAMEKAEITSITMPKHATIERIDLRENKLKQFDFTECRNLQMLSCVKNGLKAEDVARLIDVLPDRSAEATPGQLVLFDTFKDKDETNEVTLQLLDSALAKGWCICDGNGEITANMLSAERIDLPAARRDASVYTMDGIRLGTGSDPLPDGTYIIGGKKQIIRNK